MHVYGHSIANMLSISMAYCNTAVPTLLMHWSLTQFGLSHQLQLDLMSCLSKCSQVLINDKLHQNTGACVTESFIKQLFSKQSDQQRCELTLNMLNCFKDYERFIYIRIISWILYHRRRPNSQWSKSICCLFYTVKTMLADALAT